MSTFRRLKIKNYLTCKQITYSVIKEHTRRIYKSDKNESLRCSISRTTSLIKDYVLSNEFDYFVTLTLNTDIRYDINQAITLFNNIIKNYSLRCKRSGFEFKYIYIFELTEKGGVHLHGFFSGFIDLYINKYNHLSSFYFDKYGFQCFQDAKQVNYFYLIKYISKDFVNNDFRRFHKSKNLNKPVIDIIHDNIEEFSKMYFTFENNYNKMITIVND